MHIALPIGGNVLMGTDALESMGHALTMGTNISISISPGSKEEADRLFAGLSAGGSVGMPLQDMFWGGYFASFSDRFGTNWMLNCQSKT